MRKNPSANVRCCSWTKSLTMTADGVFAQAHTNWRSALADIVFQGLAEMLSGLPGLNFVADIFLLSTWMGGWDWSLASFVSIPEVERAKKQREDAMVWPIFSTSEGWLL